MRTAWVSIEYPLKYQRHKTSIKPLRADISIVHPTMSLRRHGVSVLGLWCLLRIAYSSLPESMVYASLYFAMVLSMTSCGSL